MGMCLTLYTLRDDNVRALLAHPPLVWRVISPDHAPPAHTEARGLSGLLGRLFGGRRAAAADLEMAEGEVVEADLDKAWHGIHFLLTGSAWEGEKPLDFLLCGGAEVGDVDVGFGPARAFTSGQVRAIHDALSRVDDDAARSRFDPVRMMEEEVYPMIWDADPAEDDTLGYCIDYLATLRDFLSDAAGRGCGMLVCVS